MKTHNRIGLTFYSRGVCALISSSEEWMADDVVDEVADLFIVLASLFADLIECLLVGKFDVSAQTVG